MKDL
jgi:hypothetical protein